MTISPLQFELDEQAAQELAEEALSTAARDAIVFCDPNEPACLADIFDALASRAWRRPATDEEVTRLEDLVAVAVNEGDDLEQGLELAIRGVLLSPHFIYRPELDDDPSSTESRLLDDHELAPILQPLAPVKNQVLVLSGLSDCGARQ